MFDTSESIEEQPRDKHRQRHRGNQANRFVFVVLFVLATTLEGSQKKIINIDYLIICWQ